MTQQTQNQQQAPTTAPAPTKQGGQVATTPAQRVDALKDLLTKDRIMEQFNNALKANASVFVASLVELYTSDGKLQLCQPGQVIKEALKAAALNLPINKQLGQAFIIPFYNTVKDEKGNKVKKYEPVFQIGYKGLFQLAMRTSQYRIINADVVYEGELRKASRLTGEIDLDGTRISDKVVGYFAYFELMGGFRKSLYMSVEEMASHAKRYSKALTFNREVTVESLMALSLLPVAAESNSVGWLGNFHGMAIKTVLRNLLSKYGYLNTTLQQAVEADSESDKATSKEPTTPTTTTIQTIDPETVEYEEVNEVATANADDVELPTDPDPGF